MKKYVVIGLGVFFCLQILIVVWNFKSYNEEKKRYVLPFDETLEEHDKKIETQGFEEVEDQEKDKEVDDDDDDNIYKYENFTKVIHVVSHSHWDREWYLPLGVFERKLKFLMDDLFNVIESDNGFDSFHLDGQVIPLVDVLKNDVGMRNKMVTQIMEKKLIVGPWYTSPDEFLASGEGLIRNLLLARSKLKLVLGLDYHKYLSSVGYLADNFGHISQLPQIFQGFGINSMVFSRGLETTYPSELIVEGADGSRILGIFLKNWYCNGGGVPSPDDEVRIINWFKKKKEETSRFATTKHLLLMNGCDHTSFDPYVLNGIKVSNQELKSKGNTIIIHSNLPRYISLVSQEIGKQIYQNQNQNQIQGNKDNQSPPIFDDYQILSNESPLQVKKGEMRYSIQKLSHILSTKITQKQKFWKSSTLLEKWVEPLFSLRFLLSQQEKENINLRFNLESMRASLISSWDLLVQSHAHDSVGGCSVTSVHQDVDNRLDQCLQLSQQLGDENLMKLAKEINIFTPLEEQKEDFFATISVLFFNPLSFEREEISIFFVDLSPTLLEDLRVECYDQLQGEKVFCEILRDEGVIWDYYLPSYGFRKPYNTRRLRVIMNTKLPSFGYQTYRVLFFPKETLTRQPRGFSINHGRVLENSFLHAEIQDDGTIKIKSKSDQNTFNLDPLNSFEWTSDIGDVYNFQNGGQSVTQKKEGTTIGSIVNSSLFSHCTLQIELNLGNQKYFHINVTYLLGHQSKRIDVRVSCENDMENFRLRAIFPTPSKNSQVLADGQFDVISRETTEKDFGQPNFHFVDIYDPDLRQGFAISTRGIPEYEIQRGKSTLGITLLRATGKLGDWGDFEIPSAQEKGKLSFEYSIIPHSDPFSSFDREAREFNAPIVGIQIKQYPGDISSQKFINLDNSILEEAEHLSNYIQQLRKETLVYAPRYPSSSSSSSTSKQSPLNPNYEPKYLAQKFPLSNSFLKIVPEFIILSTFKIAEERDTVILRFYNPTTQAIDSTITLNFPKSRIYECRLDEKRLNILEIPEALDQDGITLKRSLNPKQIVTLEIEPY